MIVIIRAASYRVIRARDMLGVSLEPYPYVDGWLARLAERPSIAAEIAVVAGL